MNEREKLDFSYKYPFSKEAKESAASFPQNVISIKYLEAGKRRIDESLTGMIEYKDINIRSIKEDYITTYIYARMLLSAIKNPVLTRHYARAEARRSEFVINAAAKDEILHLATELGIGMTGTVAQGMSKTTADELTISFDDFLKYSTNAKGMELANQRLSHGVIILYKSAAARLLGIAIAKEIMKGLPIKASELPPEVVAYAKQQKFNLPVTEKAYAKTDSWIDRLLEMPISDVRHRTVNLILAPYLTTIKGLSVDQATKIINDYIERCKTIDPHTNVTERYIRYQCEYAKKKGMKPLKLENAKALLGDTLEAILGGSVAK
ncbi:MAG: DNA primase noncatalytic subunit PriX [Candidatus Micrarchaeota archaeon]|nr:DNA primase noncatalytic subunit PriX [Candidatus Micrarchaeota archaeon]